MGRQTMVCTIREGGNTTRVVTIITSRMGASEVFGHLVAHGCLDATSELQSWATSTPAPAPCAGGRFGDVYKWTSQSGTTFGIKCLRLHSFSGRANKWIKDFTREARSWSKAKHKNVLGLSGIALINGQLAMVSPWMENGSLQHYAQPLPVEMRWALCIQVAEGLAYIHGINMAHGDLKAMNILVSREGVVKISDFGNSLMEEGSLGFTATTTVGGGSLRWMAPELVDEVGIDRSPMTDVYSLGMTILEVVTGRVPYYTYERDPQVMRALLERRLPGRPQQLAEPAKWGNERWELLINCWDVEALQRPTAQIIFDRMKQLR